jgi:choline dehydrogenase-like flavoprotein
MGGTGVLNGMMYMRGNRKDYDNWAALGNKGWDYESVLPYFLKSEDNQQIGDVYKKVQTESCFTLQHESLTLRNKLSRNNNYSEMIHEIRV